MSIKNIFKFKISKEQRFLFYLFPILFVLIVLSGFALYHKTQRDLKKSIHNELESIAEIKINEISNWYKDEIEDVKIISSNYFLIDILENHNDQGKHYKDELLNYLIPIKKEHSYADIYILDDKGDVILYTGNKGFPANAELQNSVLDAIKNDKLVVTDLYYSKVHGEIHMNIINPLKSKGQTVGIIVFEIHPDQYLYPFIQSWPLESETAETLILRDDGDSILFLNELRSKKGTALKLRIAKTEKNVPAIYAIDGNVGVFEGIDYRGEKVISYVNKVAGTPWYMVAKIDKDEIYNKLYESSKLGIFIIVIFILLLLALVAFLVTQSQKLVYRRLLSTQEEYKITLYSIGDAVIIAERNGFIKNMNPIAEQLTGWTEVDAVGKPIEEIFNIVNENTGDIVENPVKKVIQKGTIVGLANHTILIAKNGKRTPIADSGAPIFDEHGKITGVVLVFRDQSDEYNYKKVLEEQRRQLLTLFANLPGIAYRCINDLSWTMEFISKGCEAITGYKEEDLLGNKVISYSDLIHPNDRGFVWLEVQKAMNNRQSFELQYRIQTKDKKIKWVWERGNGLFDDDGKLLCIEGFINDITQRVKFEKALQQSERLFQTLAQNASVGIFRTDKAGNTTYVNPKWCEISGVSENDAYGDGWTHRIHPEDKNRLVVNWNYDLKNRQISNAEYRFVHSDSRIVYVKGQAVPEFGSDKEFIGYLGTITDVTSIKEAEKELLHSNRLLRTIIDNIPDAIYLKDKEGRKVVANKADIANIGVESESDVLGKTDFDLFPKEVAEHFWADDLKILRGDQEIVTVEEELINEKNEQKWLSTTKIQYKNSDNEVIGIVGIGHDITRRKHDETERMKLLTILTQSPVSIVITDVNANIEYVNPKFTEVTGYTLDEVKGCNNRILKSGTFPDEFYKEMWRVISGGAEWRGELRNKKKDGSLFWENVIISSIKRDGKIVNYVAVKEDITELRKIMEELVDAKNRAEESERLKTSFLANMSHEIRTPLNSILGFTNLLNEDDDLTKNEREEYLEIVRKNSDGLLQIINDIIDISSLETHQLKIYPTEVNLNKLLESLNKEYINRLKDVGKEEIELRFLNLDEQIDMIVDGNRLNQIFINLLTNALKFTDFGFIEFGVVEYSAQFVYFKVQDSGIGISEAMRDVIFERFRQGDNQSTKHHGGNGLGLSIVKNLIELMGGRIRLESEVGKGSTFSFYLPIR